MSSQNNIWDKMAKSFHDMSSRSTVLQDKYASVADIITKANPKSVLDLGCGSGLLESKLIKDGFKGKMCAIDSSVEMLKLAKSQCGDRVEFMQFDLDDPLKLSNKYDLIVAVNVMFFLKDKKQFLNTITGLLLDKDSIFLLINPKSNEESSIWQFIKDHFRNTTIREKIFIAINEISNFPKYWGMIKGQAQIWRMSNRGEVVIHKQGDVINMARDAGLRVKLVEDYRASQSWLFVLERGK